MTNMRLGSPLAVGLLIVGHIAYSARITSSRRRPNCTGVAGITIAAFGESPMLASLVAEGKLPPVAQRLPEEPLAVRPLVAGTSYGTSFERHEELVRGHWAQIGGARERLDCKPWNTRSSANDLKSASGVATKVHPSARAALPSGSRRITT